ncbi:MAG: Stp1/IreP family PP2C-type Ser/Thr phosphatase [Clostridia bacterium]|nr:Stp1/IreP family PP2C-type Ser/Thr phosphatase [Clostridia bacterium]
MKVIGNSDIGKVRETNEDAFRFGKYDDGSVWAVVCDGMGGVSGGRLASSIAADMVSRKIEKSYNKSMTGVSIENMLLSAITTANVTVFDRSSVDNGLRGMGTTIVACVVKGSTACIAHVGDSRAYIISGNDIRQITKDHSLVQEMLDKGQITKEQFDNHPNKNIITRVLGVDEEIEIDFDYVDVSEKDLIILCSDGLSGFVKSEQILKIFESCEFENLCDNLIEAANENGGRDNITVVAVEC